MSCSVPTAPNVFIKHDIHGSMQLQLIDKTENSIKIGIIDADTTLILPVIEKLNANNDVKIVRFIETHPELDTPALYVEMHSGDPVAAIVKASEEIAGYFSEIAKA